jgi:FAD synthetase
MRERAGERATKYLETATKSLRALTANKSPRMISSPQVDQVSSLARDYARDANHYLSNRKPVTALACIAYAEGLLDALKFLELAEF